MNPIDLQRVKVSGMTDHNQYETGQEKDHTQKKQAKCSNSIQNVIVLISILPQQ